MGKPETAPGGHAAESLPGVAHRRWPKYVDKAGGCLDNDHFSCQKDQVYAGKHLILDFWGATQLDNPALMEATLRRCVDAAGATLLHLHLHRFSPTGGLSGVAVLAESHISVHTWPEKGFAAFDIFMCGETRPERAVDTLKRAFDPQRMAVTEHLRGVIRGR